MLKKANRYLILHQVDTALQIGAAAIPAANPKFTRKEVTGEEALAFLRTLKDAKGYEIYELKGDPLILQTTVVCAKQDEVLAADIAQAAGEE